MHGATERVNMLETCDAGQCIAHAKVTVTMPSGDLVFCDHHYRYNYDLLIEHGAETYDAPMWPNEPDSEPPEAGNESPENDDSWPNLPWPDSPPDGEEQFDYDNFLSESDWSYLPDDEPPF